MSDQPNILVMMTDQQRFDSLGCYGFEAIDTPNLDRLAEEGVLFEHCYATNPICTPSRASMLTGKHLPGHGVYRLYDDLPKDEVLFPKRLQRLGYQTALIGKLHVSSITYEAANRHPNNGFDIYDWCHEPSWNLDAPHNGYARWLRETNPEFLERLAREGRSLHVPREVHMTHWAAERTNELIRQRPKGQPFFYLMSVFDPHSPYQDHPLEMRDRVNKDKLPDPILVEGELERGPAILRRLAEQTSGIGLASDVSPEEIREMRLGYYASIALIDLEFGRVLDTLEQEGIAEDTLVFFVSDHGDMLGDHMQFSKGGALYDPCTRVPFLMRWPARFGGHRRLSHLVQQHDIAATALAAAGMAAEELQNLMPDAVDLSPLCAGETDRSHDYAYCVYRNSGLCRERVKTFYFGPPVLATMIRGERFKLVLFHGTGPGKSSEGVLFDMQNDPLETVNLWDHADYLGVRLEMTERLLTWLVEHETRHLGSRGGSSIPPWWDGPKP